MYYTCICIYIYIYIWPCATEGGAVTRHSCSIPLPRVWNGV